MLEFSRKLEFRLFELLDELPINTENLENLKSGKFLGNSAVSFCPIRQFFDGRFGS